LGQLADSSDGDAEKQAWQTDYQGKKTEAAAMTESIAGDWADAKAREIAQKFHDHFIGEMECDDLCKDCIEIAAAALRAAEQCGAERMQDAAILIARKRRRQCLTSAEKFAKKKPNNEYWAASERCAAQEANHIGDLIRALPSTPRDLK